MMTRIQAKSFARKAQPESAVALFDVVYALDEAEHLFFVVSSDVPGLNVIAESLSAMEEIAYSFLPDLLGERANGARLTFKQSTDLPD